MKNFLDRPKNQLNVDETDRLDVDEALLPEGSWERTLDKDVFEVEKIMDVRFDRRTRFGRAQRCIASIWCNERDRAIRHG